MRYSILDPTGNITALVESAVLVEDQPGVAVWIMERHPEVEQVGFVSFDAASDSDRRVQAGLRMAGGEFCGNATMCAASLYVLRTEWDGREVWLDVSGAKEPVRVDLSKESQNCFETSIQMPGALEARLERLVWQEITYEVPVLHMEGISHAILRPSSPLFQLRDKPGDAVQAIRDWCDCMAVDGLGLMFLEGKDSARKKLIPLVYVPGSDTLYWEHSCASGSAAVGMYWMSHTHAPVSLELQEPGGVLRVEGDYAQGTITLHGHARLVQELSVEY